MFFKCFLFFGGVMSCCFLRRLWLIVSLYFLFILLLRLFLHSSDSSSSYSPTWSLQMTQQNFAGFDSPDLKETHWKPQVHLLKATALNHLALLMAGIFVEPSPLLKSTSNPRWLANIWLEPKWFSSPGEQKNLAWDPTSGLIRRSTTTSRSRPSPWLSMRVR